MTLIKPSVDHYDMVVVGGGVYGSAVLWEATHRGLKVLLLEKNDFCSGTSANSLKTIHGGIRYLQNLNVKRTIESDREKVILKNIASNIVEPLTCTLAATNLTTKSYVSFFAATKIFNLLSQFSALGSGRFKDVFTPSAAKRKFKIFNNIENDSRSGSGRSCMVWQDAQITNSEHLPLAFIRSSTQLGSNALNYSEVTKVRAEGSQYQITYRAVGGSEQNCSANYVVDCSAGPSLLDTSENSSDYVTGLNLMLSKQFSDYAYALSVAGSDRGKQGLLFFSPWKGSTIVGTWYFKKSEISVREDIDNAILSLCINDIVEAFAGSGVTFEHREMAAMIEDFHLGFLPADLSETNPEKSIVERVITTRQGSGYFELKGNKYTTARLNAKELVDEIAQTEPRIENSNSHALPLSGLSVATPEVAQLFEGSEAWLVLLGRYGEFANEFYTLIAADPSALQLVPGSNEIYRIEVEYFSQHMQTRRLADLLYRRININVHKPISEQTVSWSAQRMAELNQWSDQAMGSNIDEVSHKEKQKAELKLRLSQAERNS